MKSDVNWDQWILEHKQKYPNLFFLDARKTTEIIYVRWNTFPIASISCGDGHVTILTCFYPKNHFDARINATEAEIKRLKGFVCSPSSLYSQPKAFLTKLTTTRTKRKAFSDEKIIQLTQKVNRLKGIAEQHQAANENQEISDFVKEMKNMTKEKREP